ncbi:uncharacterized protein V6R79_005240 [Siganus canaliculatus]
MSEETVQKFLNPEDLNILPGYRGLSMVQNLFGETAYTLYWFDCESSEAKSLLLRRCQVLALTSNFETMQRKILEEWNHSSMTPGQAVDPSNVKDEEHQ